MFASKLSIVALATLITAGLATPHAFAKTGGNGWQTAVTVTVATGTTDQFEHIPCPTGFYAQSGGFFAFASAVGNGFALTGQGPRLDLNPPQYGEWAWNFVWPNGGAPAGAQLVFNVLCKKGNP
ncbi:MAG TPA: hypothetical protein VMB71_02935 [Acetobacteraceae bacterium]|nr:hypothetical protein [Acetobacteraceae bacterium]